MASLKVRATLSCVRSTVITWVVFSILIHFSFVYCDDDAITSMPISKLLACSNVASASAGCSGEESLDCLCGDTTYSVALRDCVYNAIENITLKRTAIEEAEYQLLSICQPYTLMVYSLCEDCTLTAIDAASCLNYEDTQCLCGPNGEKYGSAFTSCIQTHTNGTYTCASSFLGGSDQLYTRCSFDSFTRCNACKTSIQTERDCRNYDYACLCSDGEYPNHLTSCLDSGCSPQNITDERELYSTACSGRQQLESYSPASVTELIRPPDVTSVDIPVDGNADDDESDSGPKTGVVVASVIGAIAGLAFLLFGGYYVFKNDRDTWDTEKGWKKKSKLVSTTILKPWMLLTGSNKSTVSNGHVNTTNLCPGLQQIPPYELSGSSPQGESDKSNSNGPFEMDAQRDTYQEQQGQQEGHEQQEQQEHHERQEHQEQQEQNVQPVSLEQQSSQTQEEQGESLAPDSNGQRHDEEQLQP